MKSNRLKGDGKNINLLMVDENHAVKYEGQSKDDIKKEHLVNSEKLIEKGVFDPNVLR